MDRPKNKATMDQPQEEFIQSLSSSVDEDETSPGEQAPLLAPAGISIRADEIDPTQLIPV
jgi:hypothetical protein